MISFYTVCKYMQDIYSNHKNIFPNDLLKFIWPDGSSLFKDGTDLTDVEFIHHFDKTHSYSDTMDTNYAPISWATLIALNNIFIDKYIDPNRGSRYNFLTDEKRTPNEESVLNSIPFLIEWADWCEDDNMHIHCCSDREFEHVMNLSSKDSILWNIIKPPNDTEADDAYNVHFYIGVIDPDKNDIHLFPETSDSYNPHPSYLKAMDLKTWMEKVNELKREGYRAMLVQCAYDDSLDYEVVYWMVKFDL